MALLQIAGLVTLIAFSSVAKAQITTPCTYQEYVCGSTLLANGMFYFSIIPIKLLANLAIKDTRLLPT